MPVSLYLDMVVGSTGGENRPTVQVDIKTFQSLFEDDAPSARITTPALQAPKVPVHSIIYMGLGNIMWSFLSLT